MRGHDYHIDWIDADGKKKSTPKMAFDWRRLTETEKQSKIDFARHIIDSVTALDGYRMKVCAGGRSISFDVAPPLRANGDVAGNNTGRSSGSAATATSGGGSRGVLYLLNGDSNSGFTIEKVRVVR